MPRSHHQSMFLRLNAIAKKMSPARRQVKRKRVCFPEVPSRGGSSRAARILPQAVSTAADNFFGQRLGDEVQRELFRRRIVTEAIQAGFVAAPDQTPGGEDLRQNHVAF